MPKKLYKSKEDRVIAGVAGGLGEYFEIDPVIIRVLFVVALLAGGGGFIAYVILMIVMPEENEVNSETKKEIKEDGKKVEKSADNRRITKQVNYTAGFVLMAAGVLLLLDQFTVFPITELWPVLIIALAVGVIINGASKK